MRKQNFLKILLAISLVLILNLSLTFGNSELVHECSDDNQVIMKLHQESNSHGALANYLGQGYDYEICYDEIFGEEYIPEDQDPHSCNFFNELLRLYKPGNYKAVVLPTASEGYAYLALTKYWEGKTMQDFCEEVPGLAGISEYNPINGWHSHPCDSTFYDDPINIDHYYVIYDEKVITLGNGFWTDYSAFNSHAEIPGLDTYDIPVCYGDLECRIIDNNLGQLCDQQNEKIILSLSSETNSHLSAGNNPDYDLKVCCKSENSNANQETETHGNGIIEGNEECDDGNLNNGDGCSSECEIEDNYVCVGEPSVCTLIEQPTIECSTNSECGTDSWVGEEFCNGPNNNVWQNFQEFICHNPGTEESYCGSSILSMLKQECNLGCKSGECIEEETETHGNGIIEGNEECDDGNLNNGDGCSSECEIEDNYVCVGEPSVCTLEHFCGDGILDILDEECDDGNLNNGDGCSSECLVEEDDDNDKRSSSPSKRSSGFIDLTMSNSKPANENFNILNLKTDSTGISETSKKKNIYGILIGGKILSWILILEVIFILLILLFMISSKILQ